MTLTPEQIAAQEREAKTFRAANRRIAYLERQLSEARNLADAWRNAAANTGKELLKAEAQLSECRPDREAMIDVVHREFDKMHDEAANKSTAYNVGKFAEATIDAIMALQGAGWRDISTAPKDGTPMILCFANLKIADAYHITDADEFGHKLPQPLFLHKTAPLCFEGRWWRSGAHNNEGSGWYSNTRHAFLKQPTHWMHLPTPPEGDK